MSSRGLVPFSAVAYPGSVGAGVEYAHSLLRCSGHGVEPRSGLLVGAFDHRIWYLSTVGWIRGILGAIRGSFLRFLHATVRISDRYAIAICLNLAKVFRQ